MIHFSFQKELVHKILLSEPHQRILDFRARRDLRNPVAYSEKLRSRLEKGCT